MASDRRTSGTYIEDQEIELKAQDRISQEFKDKAHVNVTSYNRSVLLTGEVPSRAAKDRVVQIARSIENVRAITDELAVMETSSFGSRSDDVLITTKIRGQFLNSNAFPANVVKVVTERGVVYLLGIVSHKEADAATQIASTTGGVQQVVKLFEYTD
jgi:osmotically-inducible protein OsmY